MAIIAALPEYKAGASLGEALGKLLAETPEPLLDGMGAPPEVDPLLLLAIALAKKVE